MAHMTHQLNVAEAKARLSELVSAAEAGEEVVIARSGKPIVRLVPVAPPKRRELGFLPLAIDDSFFEPLDDDDLIDWE